MSLDKLISKYLDGELNQQEDIELRKYLSEDESARDTFDASVHLHLAFREDAESINPPEDLVLDTEDIVLMKILQQPAIAMPRVNFKASLPKVSYALTAVLILLLFNVTEISELFRGFSSNDLVNSSVMNSSSETDRPIDIDHLSAETLANAVSNVNSTSDFAAVSNQPSDDDELLTGTPDNIDAEVDYPESYDVASSLDENELTSFGSVNENDITLNITETNIETEESFSMINESIKENSSSSNKNSDRREFFGRGLGSDSEREKSNAVTSEFNEVPLSPTSNNMPVMDNMLYSGFQPQLKDVQLSTFVGNDFYRSGMKSAGSENITHFSQSVAYGVNDNTRFGIEFGYTNYNVLELKEIRVPITGFDPTDNIGFVTKVDVQKEYQLFWGSLFYEYSVINNENISLVARMGVGSSIEGALGYGRIFGKIKVIDGIALTFGTETRAFMAKFPQANRETSWKTSCSLLYGLLITL